MPVNHFKVKLLIGIEKLFLPFDGLEVMSPNVGASL